MSKIQIPISADAGRLLVPKPIVLVTCADKNRKPNIIPLGNVNVISVTPLIYQIGIRPRHHSHKLVEETGEFVINIPTTDLIEQVEYCGTKSGRDVDKFEETKLTPKPAEYVDAPLIDECPVNIECQVVDKMRPGTHTMFAGKVLAIHLKEGIFNGKSLDLEKAPTIGYTFTAYRGVGKLLKER